MSIKETGNNLTSPQTQPGWTVMSDGFGLMTATVTYKQDWSANPNTLIARGTPLDFAGYTYLKAHKGSFSHDSLNYMTVKVDYVGIDPNVNSGAWTNANTSAANGLTAQSITSHPAFFTATAPFSEDIAGPITAPNYTEDTTGEFAPKVGDGYGYLGKNGSCFEKKKGGRFIGFVKPAFRSLYGKTQYLEATTTFSGVMYVNIHQSARIFLDYLGSATSTDSWGPFKVLPSWAEVGTGTFGNVNLLSQVNVEEYGTLYKVMYEIRYSREGWDPKVYWNVNAE
jgi:hypothetical protein